MGRPLGAARRGGKEMGRHFGHKQKYIYVRRCVQAGIWSPNRNAYFLLQQTATIEFIDRSRAREVNKLRRLYCGGRFRFLGQCDEGVRVVTLKLKLGGHTSILVFPVCR